MSNITSFQNLPLELVREILWEQSPSHLESNISRVNRDWYYLVSYDRKLWERVHRKLLQDKLPSLANTRKFIDIAMKKQYWRLFNYLISTTNGQEVIHSMIAMRKMNKIFHCSIFYRAMRLKCSKKFFKLLVQNNALVGADFFKKTIKLPIQHSYIFDKIDPEAVSVDAFSQICAYGYYRIAHWMIENIEQLDINISNGMNTPLASSARNGHIDVVELLLLKGADIECDFGTYCGIYSKNRELIVNRIRSETCFRIVLYIETYIAIVTNYG
eukprot:TRINITY_DN962_c0_g1_i3.p1 TRINITY_DN962_c0_g1~~TRINITY_DN962_c0_g1_i3.p1  ORF type:complete len:271 (+),score=13.35 TRINITY_DN962_c0_g1_i3:27-839(+)